MKVSEIIAGMKFGRLTVRQKVADAKGVAANLKKRVRVQCDCGRKLTIPTYYLVREPHPKVNCGECEDLKSLKVIHANVYTCWYMMRTRCNDPKHVAYDHYAGRGIKVCDEWNNSETGFEAFLSYIGPRPSPSHSIDRFPDPDGNYEPGNVRWATPKEQANNKSIKYPPKNWKKRNVPVKDKEPAP